MGHGPPLWSLWARCGVCTSVNQGARCMGQQRIQGDTWSRVSSIFQRHCRCEDRHCMNGCLSHHGFRNMGESQLLRCGIFFLSLYLFIYFWLCQVFIAVHRLSLVVDNGGQLCLHCGAQAQVLLGMWDLSEPGIEPMSPVLVDSFLTTRPPGKPQLWNLGQTYQHCSYKWILDIAIPHDTSILQYLILQYQIHVVIQLVWP